MLSLLVENLEEGRSLWFTIIAIIFGIFFIIAGNIINAEEEAVKTWPETIGFITSSRIAPYDEEEEDSYTVYGYFCPSSLSSLIVIPSSLNIINEFSSSVSIFIYDVLSPAPYSHQNVCVLSDKVTVSQSVTAVPSIVADDTVPSKSIVKVISSSGGLSSSSSPLPEQPVKNTNENNNINIGAMVHYYFGTAIILLLSFVNACLLYFWPE